ncbi:alpha/beta hydrolase [Labrys monachus]|uniref:Arylformamidase n=1 Tax=Labrys monachus TaxID=217067 RepID=A0ABU0FCB1_9HYPH|nr:alpha/beta hydrolase [Labrys monachus]MDQ0391769.1 arylformamidase [Labrys monachus]
MAETADPFMIRAHVPHFERCVADYRAASEATRGRLAGRLGLAYGGQADERLDLFFPPGHGPQGRPAPIHIFVHGGYWRANTRHDYAFVADAVTARGAIAAIVDYSLMPGARMATLVAQVRSAAAWIAAHAAEFGGDPAAISASGHSAGGHLASYLVGRGPFETDVPAPAVRSVLLVSGLYDLAPIARSFLQAEIGLTEEEIAAWSPCDGTVCEGSDIRILVGAAETPPFFDQAQRFSAHLAEAGHQAPVHRLEGEDHMTIVRSLGRPGTACEAHLGATIAASLGK